jgi:spore coat protein SA
MRIVSIGTDRLPVPPKFGGAYETYIYGVSKTLVRMGHEVHIISFDYCEREYEKDGIIYHTFSLNSPISKVLSKFLGLIDEPNKNVPYVNVKILKILETINMKYGFIDVIHAHLLATCLAPIIFRRIYSNKTKLVLHWHNEPTPRKMKKWINRWIAQEYDIHCAVSNYIRNKLINYLNINPAKVEVIYNAVDDEIFRFNIGSRKEMRHKLGLHDEYIVLYVGRIIPEKGLHHLILALPYVIKHLQKVKLIIVGPKGHYEKEERDYYSYIDELIKRLCLQNFIIYLGSLQREDLPKIYSASDVVVVPSLFQDACPTVILEAMACGRPVIAYNTGGIPEIIEKGITGYLVEKGDIEMLQKALVACFNQNNHENIALNSRMRINKYFTFSAICEKLIRLYQKQVK